MVQRRYEERTASHVRAGEAPRHRSSRDLPRGDSRHAAVRPAASRASLDRPRSHARRAASTSRPPAQTSYLNASIKAFRIVLAVGCVVGLLFFLRPSVSEAENRTLTEFPAITWEGFWDGTWTSNVSTWYADTYPFRDQLIAVDQAIDSLFGLHIGPQMYGSVGSVDQIPAEGDTSEASQEKERAPLPETYDASALEDEIQGILLSGVYVKDGAVYANYGFTQAAAEAYGNAITAACENLQGTQVYSILIPNNSAVLLSEDELAAMGGSNQWQAIDYYYSLYPEEAISVPTYDALMGHNDEYLYFRTDHHWTALGAYYVYRSFCEQKGIEPHELSQFTEMDFTGFSGSYTDTLDEAGSSYTPDTVQAWIPMGTNDMSITHEDGTTADWWVVSDVTDWNDNSKYSCFVGGDQPWSVIHNPNITDGSSCVVVKESYGNAFVPWLVDHYETVYVADFRYTTTNIADFCNENDVDDLIVINNIQICGSVSVANKIESLLTLSE